MNWDDLFFYVLDIAVFVMLIIWTKNSREVKVPSKVPAQWLVPVLFLVIGGYGFFRYAGVFKYLQTGFMVVFAVMYYFLKSGLSEKGVVMNGALTPWSTAGKITVMKKEGKVVFQTKRREVALYYDRDQLEEARKFLAARSVKSEKH